MGDERCGSHFPMPMSNAATIPDRWARTPTPKGWGCRGGTIRAHTHYIYTFLCASDLHDGGAPYRSQYLNLPRAGYMFRLRLTSKIVSTASKDMVLKTKMIIGWIEVGIEGKSFSVTDKKKRRIAPPSRHHSCVNSAAFSLKCPPGSLLIVRVWVMLSATLMMIPCLLNWCINALACAAYLCGVLMGIMQYKSIPLVARPQ